MCLSQFSPTSEDGKQFSFGERSSFVKDWCDAGVADTVKTQRNLLMYDAYRK